MEQDKDSFDFFEEWPGWASTNDNNNYSQQCSFIDTLKLGFDSLPSFVEKECLRYVALFPKNRIICESDLIEYWIGEGFLSHGCCDVREVVKRGENIIRLLISRNLLVEVTYQPKRVKAVKMHHTLRELFLQSKFGDFDGILVTEDFQITHQAMVEKASRPGREKAVKLYHDLSDSFRQGKFKDFGGMLVRLLTQSESDSVLLEKWRYAKIVNTSYEISEKEWQQMPYCPYLQTLILSHYRLFLPMGISDIFPFLKVLDLSRSSIEVLPPSIGNLKYLQYLNISYTSIKSLPSELARLTKLKCLKLSYCLKNFPENIILKLKELQLLEMVGARGWLGKHNFDEFVQEMQCLENLGILKISVYCFDLVDRLIIMERLARCITYLSIDYIELPWVELLPLFERMPYLEYLEISSSSRLGTITLHGLQDQGFPSSLYTLCIYDCSNLEIFDVQHACLPILQNLRKFQIELCPMMKSISWVKYLPNLIDFVIS